MGSLSPSAWVLSVLVDARPLCSYRLCGTYPPSYNLTFLSSQNVLLVTLITSTGRRHPGFEAMFFQLPKMSSKEGQAWGGEGDSPQQWVVNWFRSAQVSDRVLKLKPKALLPLTGVMSPS